MLFIFPRICSALPQKLCILFLTSIITVFHTRISVWFFVVVSIFLVSKFISFYLLISLNWGFSSFLNFSNTSYYQFLIKYITLFHVSGLRRWTIIDIIWWWHSFLIFLKFSYFCMAAFPLEIPLPILFRQGNGCCCCFSRDPRFIMDRSAPLFLFPLWKNS